MPDATLSVLYSHNKRGFERAYWQREIAAASGPSVRFIPFDHGALYPTANYVRGQTLDNAWFDKDPGLIALYDALRRTIEAECADALVVDNYNPYHPEFLRELGIHTVLRMSDGPTVAYDRDFTYAHAFDQVLYHTRAYSPEINLPDKLAYLGVRRADFWPLALFDANWRPGTTIDELLGDRRDIDIMFVGALHLDKMPLLASVKRAFGRRCHLYGLTTVKRNLYFKYKHGAPGWVRPIAFEDYVPLYRRSKIGFNVHLRGDYTVGGFRMFELPANGVLQISDGGQYLNDFYEVGREVEGFAATDELIAKIDHFLTNDRERQEHVRAAFARTMADHRIGHRMAQLEGLLRAAIADGQRTVRG